MLLTALRWLMLLVAASLVGLILYAGDPRRVSWWFPAILFGLWVVGPAIAPYFLAKRFQHRRWFVYSMTGYLVISSIWSAQVYDQALFVSTSSTSALVLVFTPLYQWAALVCVALLSLGLREVFSLGSGSTP
jgi:hypothetical protein